LLSQHEADYHWLSDVYESVRPVDITGRLIWHALGAKTVDLINQHVVVELPRNDLETIILDVDVLSDLMNGKKSSLDFLRDLLQLARDTVAAEKQVGEKPREEQGKAALTELFESLQGDGTPVIVENVVNSVDQVVRAVRFDGWQDTHQGDQEVRQALRKVLYIQFKIRDNDVFEKALGYVREYY
jgi:type I restriction enzyme, R subunit